MPRQVTQTVAPSRPAVKYSIQAKSAEYVFCPANAIEPEFYRRNPYTPFRMVTTDGIVNDATFIETWYDRAGVFTDEFDSVCQRYYGMNFESIKSIWIGRLGTLDDYWHLIKLEKE